MDSSSGTATSMIFLEAAGRTRTRMIMELRKFKDEVMKLRKTVNENKGGDRRGCQPKGGGML